MTSASTTKARAIAQARSAAVSQSLRARYGERSSVSESRRRETLRSKAIRLGFENEQQFLEASIREAIQSGKDIPMEDIASLDPTTRTRINELVDREQSKFNEQKRQQEIAQIRSDKIQQQRAFAQARQSQSSSPRLVEVAGISSVEQRLGLRNIPGSATQSINLRSSPKGINEQKAQKSIQFPYSNIINNARKNNQPVSLPSPAQVLSKPDLSLFKSLGRRDVIGTFEAIEAGKQRTAQLFQKGYQSTKGILGLQERGGEKFGQASATVLTSPYTFPLELGTGIGGTLSEIKNAPAGGRLNRAKQLGLEGLRETGRVELQALKSPSTYVFAGLGALGGRRSIREEPILKVSKSTETTTLPPTPRAIAKAEKKQAAQERRIEDRGRIVSELQLAEARPKARIELQGIKQFELTGQVVSKVVERKPGIDIGGSLKNFQIVRRQPRQLKGTKEIRTGFTGEVTTIPGKITRPIVEERSFPSVGIIKEVAGKKRTQFTTEKILKEETVPLTAGKGFLKVEDKTFQTEALAGPRKNQKSITIGKARPEDKSFQQIVGASKVKLLKEDRLSAQDKIILGVKKKDFLKQYDLAFKIIKAERPRSKDLGKGLPTVLKVSKENPFQPKSSLISVDTKGTIIKPIVKVGKRKSTREIKILPFSQSGKIRIFKEGGIVFKTEGPIKGNSFTNIAGRLKSGSTQQVLSGKQKVKNITTTKQERSIIGQQAGFGEAIVRQTVKPKDFVAIAPLKGRSRTITRLNIELTSPQLKGLAKPRLDTITRKSDQAVAFVQPKSNINPFVSREKTSGKQIQTNYPINKQKNRLYDVSLNLPKLRDISSNKSSSVSSNKNFESLRNINPNQNRSTFPSPEPNTPNFPNFPESPGTDIFRFPPFDLPDLDGGGGGGRGRKKRKRKFEAGLAPSVVAISFPQTRFKLRKVGGGFTGFEVRPLTKKNKTTKLSGLSGFTSKIIK